MRVKITKGRGWSLNKEGEEFDVYGVGVEEGEIVYYVDPEFKIGRRFIRISNCEVVEDETDASTDNVNSPQHYTQGRFETIEMIEEIAQGYDDGFLGHCVGTAVKYLSRAPYKHESPVEDLKKAEKYIQFAIERAKKLEVAANEKRADYE